MIRGYSMETYRLLRWLVFFAVAAPSAAYALRDNATRYNKPLSPTPHATPEAVIAALKKQQLSEVEISGRDRKDHPNQVAGKLIRREDGSFAFMPLQLHHMAVEHWFLSGLKREDLPAELRREKRIFVRLAGTYEKMQAFGTGSKALHMWGNGLQHGGSYKGVMGYHERIYRFKVDRVVWARSLTAFVAELQRFGTIRERLHNNIKERRFTNALKDFRLLSEVATDVGYRVHAKIVTEAYLKGLILMHKPCAELTDADIETLAYSITRSRNSMVYEKGEEGYKLLAAAVPKWSKAKRARLAEFIAPHWHRLTYRFEREDLLDLLGLIGGPAAEDMKAKFERAVAETKRLHKRRRDCAARFDYDGIVQVLKEVQPHQQVALSYEFDPDKVKHWRPDLESCIRLQKVWTDRAARMALLKELIGKLLEQPKRSGARPWLPEDLAVHWFGKLENEERASLAKLILERIRPLDPEKEYKQTLIAARLLTGLPTPEVKAFFPTLLNRYPKENDWRQKVLKELAQRLNKKE